MRLDSTLTILTTLSLTQAFTPPILRRPFHAGPHPDPNQATMSDPSTSSTQILSDILGLSKAINIFASLTRDVSPVTARLSTHDLNTTLLAPLNGAITSLPRKPWEDPREYAAFGTEAYEGKDGEDRAGRNLRRFVEAHVVPVSPWEEKVRVKTLGGGEVWWEEDGEGTRRIFPGGVEVGNVGSSVGNGAVWILKGVLNYA
ncbi:FAS1 domain-containing protein [Elsinoe ampelina]|uniref:FAS1 domain-containing protein n=1 Tax=Elsinoe ampelina TaxID=302913 RepID=A0A6A6GER5_9PEZI|nr:FAS1 domain-containing protein [Elsinoe ampelina]